MGAQRTGTPIWPWRRASGTAVDVELGRVDVGEAHNAGQVVNLIRGLGDFSPRSFPSLVIEFVESSLTGA